MVIARYFLSFFLLWTIGCVSHRGTAVLRDVDISLPALQRLIIQSFPEEPAQTLNKGRLFISKPFIVDKVCQYLQKGLRIVTM